MYYNTTVRTSWATQLAVWDFSTTELKYVNNSFFLSAFVCVWIQIKSCSSRVAVQFTLLCIPPTAGLCVDLNYFYSWEWSIGPACMEATVLHFCVELWRERGCFPTVLSDCFLNFNFRIRTSRWWTCWSAVPYIKYGIAVWKKTTKSSHYIADRETNLCRTTTVVHVSRAFCELIESLKIIVMEKDSVSIPR